MIKFSRYLPAIRLMFFSFAWLPMLATAQSSWKTSAISYLQKKLAKPDGGYGWEDQYDSHLTPTYAAIGILYNLDKLPANKENLIAFIKSHHPQRGKNKEAGPSGTEMRDLIYQQIQSLEWLNGDASSFKTEVTNWKPQNKKVSNFEEHGYPVFLQEMMTPVCRGLLDISMQDVSEHFTSYIKSRRRENGSYNNAPTTDGGDGNILNTYWGLFGAQQLKINDDQQQQTSDWIKQCQVKNGGFTHQPNADLGSNDEVAYTWAAVKSLQMLSAEPANKTACINYLISLRNDDGGFGNRPGLPSTALSTFYAIDALKALDAFSVLDRTKFTSKPKKKPLDLSGYKVFTVQFEAQGVGSPAEAVMLADSLHINLWGTKNSSRAWQVTAQKMADAKKIPVTFFQSDEAYGKGVTIAGQGTFSHIMDYMAPASVNKGLALDGSSWQNYRRTFVDPLIKDNGTLILQVTNNEPLGRILLDESVKNGGFAGISTIHFSQNFLFWLPWLEQYRHQLPYIALQDAHGTQAWWWINELAAYRTLFLGKTGSYDELMYALKNNLVVAVRHDEVSDYKTRMLGGADGVQSYILAQQDKWKWWNKSNTELNHPWAALTIISSKDSFEVAAPKKGVNIRVRCWWNSVRQSLKEPMVTLQNLKIDNVIVKPEYIEVKGGRDGISDSYYLYAIPDANNKEYKIEAELKNVKTSAVKKMTKTFTYKNGQVY